MIIVFNKSNRPIGIAGQSVLPDREIKVKDKDAYCAVFDENGHDTGKKALLPGLKALENRGFVSIRAIDEKPVEEPVKPQEEPAEETAEEPAEPKKKTTRSRSKKSEEPAE